MPLFGIPLFWLLPLAYALPANIAIWLTSAFLYRLIRKAMRKPLQDGFHSLIGSQAEVVSRLTPEHSAQYLIRCHGELWSAYSKDTLQPGELVNIVGVKGIGVVVEPVGDGHKELSRVKLARVRDNERHCY
jgi:membrane protein implicated in regulation of membrane protease activity